MDTTPNVGDELRIIKRVIEEPGETPGGICAEVGDLVIVRRLDDTKYKMHVSVSHEDRTDGCCFLVYLNEVEPWSKFEIRSIGMHDTSDAKRDEFAELFDYYWWEGEDTTGDMRPVAKNNYKACIHDKNSFGLFAFFEGKMVGFCLLTTHHHTASFKKAAYIADLFVAPEYRRQGLAREFIRQAEKLAKKYDWFRVYWMTNERNKKAQALYDDVAGRKTHVWYEIQICKDQTHLGTPR